MAAELPWKRTGATSVWRTPNEELTGNAMSDFRTTGIFPWNPDCISDHAFTISVQITNTDSVIN